MAIISVADVEARGSRSYTEDEYGVVEQLINDMQAEMEAYLDRSVEVRTFTDERHVVEWTQPRIFLRNTPVVSILSVNINGVVYGEGTGGWDELSVGWGGGYGWERNSSGFNVLGAPGVVYPPQSTEYLPVNSVIYVTYTGGLDTSKPENAALKSILLRTVLRQAALANEGDQSLTGFTRMQVDDYSWQKDPTVVAGTGFAGPFTPMDVQILDRYRRRRPAII